MSIHEDEIQLIQACSIDLDETEDNTTQPQNTQTFKKPWHSERSRNNRHQTNAHNVISPFEVSGAQHHQGSSNQTEIYVPSNKHIVEIKHISRTYDYFDYALCAAFCCFCPTGMIALYKSYKVKKLLQKNDLQSAEKYADEARLFSSCSIITGIIIIALFILLITAFHIV